MSMRTETAGIVESAEDQIARLADHLLANDYGVPRCDDEHPNGMGAVDAAIVALTEMRALMPEGYGGAPREGWAG